MKLTASCVPWMMLSTPSGKPASRAISASSMDVSGTRSDGLSKKVFPVVTCAGGLYLSPECHHVMSRTLGGDSPQVGTSRGGSSLES